MLSRRTFSVGACGAGLYSVGTVDDLLGNFREGSVPKFYALSSCRCKRVIGNFVGDGTTDNSPASETLFQGGKGSLISLDAGEYVFSENLQLPNHTRIVGAGRGLTLLRKQGRGRFILLSRGCTLENLSVLGNHEQTEGEVLIEAGSKVSDAAWSSLRNVDVGDESDIIKADGIGGDNIFL